MALDDQREPDMERLIEAIWGPAKAEAAPPADPTLRERQNQELAAALTAYLRDYLSDSPAH